jgi:hypothetical protein
MRLSPGLNKEIEVSRDVILIMFQGLPLVKKAPADRSSAT